MHGRARVILLSIALLLPAAKPQFGQGIVQTPLPTITASNESWYLNGAPITYGGNLYYPAGAQIYFNANEMVRSGFYMGVPLYTRTTLEPFSVVFVPLDGGRMQPYARPRTGELTGTAGSIPATLPAPPQTVPPPGLAPQAAGPPSETTQIIWMQLPRPAVVAPPETEARPALPSSETAAAVGTTGTTVWRPMHTQIGGTPRGSNSIFIEYAGRRWYPTGAPEAIDRRALTRLADFEGFDVWGDVPDATAIFVPAVRGGESYVRYTPTYTPARTRR